MGIGVSLAFIAIGAILAFALRVELSGIDITLVGLILILVGLISMGFTLRYTRPRRRAGRVVGADPAYGDEPEEVIHEEHIVEEPAPAGRPAERVERVIERPAEGSVTHSNVAQDPAYAQDPAHAQDPAVQNASGLDAEGRAVPRRRWRRTVRR
ncbi:DUF6458 family protein [Actinomadura sp. GC306]|uniref:DUF6458 family protein n=1 Tax=Actinomadura sp. GC306 TaxID=2530367 RepID=UPI001A9F8A01|nr:DUF6458 family protein [Actinomadura sp. GC306]